MEADRKASPQAAFQYAWQKNMPENRTMVFRQTSAAAQVAKRHTASYINHNIFLFAPAALHGCRFLQSVPGPRPQSHPHPGWWTGDAVSYTHLDVYKRQSLIWSIIFFKKRSVFMHSLLVSSISTPILPDPPWSEEFQRQPSP